MLIGEGRGAIRGANAIYIPEGWTEDISSYKQCFVFFSVFMNVHEQCLFMFVYVRL